MVIWLRNPNAELVIGEQGAGLDNDVLRSEQFATLIEIEQGYDEMRQRCDEALQAAHAEAHEIREQAYADVRALMASADEEYAQAAQQGFDAGLKQALTDWHARGLDLDLSAQARQQKQRDRLAELVVMAVEQIVADVDPALLFAQAASTVERIVADGSPLKVRVHPDDLAAATVEFERLAAVWRDGGRTVRLYVSGDAQLERGGCLCETDIGAIDASVSLHIAAMRDAIARALNSVPEVLDEADYDEAAYAPQGEAYAGEAEAYVGETEAYEGEAEAHVGETEAYEAEAYAGETEAYEGETEAYAGETEAYEGEAETYEGEAEVYAGETEPAEGETEPYVGEPTEAAA
jgi:type III secretion protein L